ncbi:hypothetical protein KW507_15680 [Vibrio fluvialis]|nr:hypothetical protein [Vibrio fluvialis]
MPEVMTIVFQYEKGASLPQRLTKAFADNAPFEGVHITAISREDEISRVESLESLEPLYDDE